VHDHLVDQAAQQRLALGLAQQWLRPQLREGLAEGGEGRPQLVWYRDQIRRWPLYSLMKSGFWLTSGGEY